MKSLPEKEKKELDDLIVTDFAQPDPDFKQKLRNKTIARYNAKNPFFDFFNAKNWKFILASFVCITLVVLYGALEVINLNSSTTSGTQVFTANEKAALFENIIKNNSPTLLTQSDTQPSLPVNTIANTNKVTTPTVKPDLSQYNYRTTTLSIKPNQSSNTCSNVSLFPSQEETVEVTEFFSVDTNYTKYVIKDKDGALIDYKLIKVTKDTTEIIDYQGGKFATRTVQKNNLPVQVKPLSYPSSYPTSYPVSYSSSSQSDSDLIQQYMKNYSTQNTSVTALIKDNNTQYYQIERKYQVDCGIKQNPLSYTTSYPEEPIVVGSEPSSYPTLHSSAQSESKQLYYIDNVDTKTFTITRSEVYLGEIKDSNLIGVITSSTNKKLTDFTSVSNQFNFEYSAEIRDVK